jgi:hypothetical protein
MAKSNSDSKNFILEFFKNAKISDKNNVLTITDVASDFEDFLGKKAPYTLVFDFDTHNKVEDSELIMKGSYFLLAIRDYMRMHGQTSLLKMDLTFSKPNLKKNIRLGNCILQDVEEKSGYHYFPEFTFLSICQYLNEKQQFTSKIQIKEGQVLSIDTTKLKAGKKEDLKYVNVDKEYQFARSKLKDLINKEAKDLKSSLREKLEKELKRVKAYYGNQIKEKDEEVERCVDKIKLLESELKHTYYDRDISILKRKIREYGVILEKLKEKDLKTRLKQEEDFHINDEMDKHILSINNTLLNVSIIYYPSLTYSLFLKKDKKHLGKTIELGYDPLSKTFDVLKCSSCGDQVKKINLCSKDHLVCQKCLKSCQCCKSAQ